MDTKKLIEGLEKVQEKKKQSKAKFGRYGYYGLEEYKERLASAFGIGGTMDTYSDIQVKELSTGQVLILATCQIDAVMEDGSLRKIGAGVGSWELMQDDTGKYFGLNNAGRLVTGQAFKAACSDMGMFGIFEEEESTEGDNQNIPSQQQKEERKVEKIMFYLPNPPEDTGKQENGKPVYRLKGHVAEGDGCRKSPSEIVIYPKVYTKNVELFNRLLTMPANGMKATLHVKPLNGKPFSKDCVDNFYLARL